MKILYILLLIILFSACGVKDCEECPEWQECAMVWEPFSNKWECSAVLKKYNGRWTGTQTIVDYLGNSTTNTLTELMSLCIHPEYNSQIHFNSNDQKYILFNYPLSSYDFSTLYNGIQLDENLNNLLLEFLNPNSGNFTINDSIYDPSVNSVVLYQGKGRIIQYNSSVNSITLEFDCSYEFDGHSTSVTFSGTAAGIK
tara:strand:+ start:291 stop:884 length:594 start_codon:yes stop_codon:yes gene_type:complete